MGERKILDLRIYVLINTQNCTLTCLFILLCVFFFYMYSLDWFPRYCLSLKLCGKLHFFLHEEMRDYIVTLYYQKLGCNRNQVFDLCFCGYISTARKQYMKLLSFTVLGKGFLSFLDCSLHRELPEGYWCDLR